MIFAPGAYTWGNKGDAALVTAFLRWLKEDFNASRVGLTSFTPRIDSQMYDADVHHMVVRPMSLARRVSERAMSLVPLGRSALTHYRLLQTKLTYAWLPLWVRIYQKTPRLAKALGHRSLYALTSEIDRARFVFTVPGGYLLAPRSQDDWWLYHVPNIRLGKLLGKTVILGPSSIGPFADDHLAAAMRMLQDVDAVVIREERSREYLRLAGYPDNRVLRSPDIAFLHLPSEPSELGLRDLDSIAAMRSEKTGVVGVSVRKHSFPGYENPSEMFERYLGAVVDSLAALAVDNVGVVLVSQTEEDVSTTKRLAALLRSAGVAFHEADSSLSPSDLQRLYGSLDLLIGTRMHANILALTMGTPVVGIAYEPKTIGILESVGLERWGLWIHEVDSGRLEGLVREAWSMRGITVEDVSRATASLRAEFSEVADQLKMQFGL